MADASDVWLAEAVRIVAGQHKRRRNRTRAHKGWREELQASVDRAEKYRVTRAANHRRREDALALPPLPGER